MARLDDIPRNTPFTTPEGYFDNLPGKIQSRISPPETSLKRSPVVHYAVRLALPAILLTAAFLYYRSGPGDAETILASVGTDAMIDYLQDTGMTTDEILENVDLTAAELEGLENEVYNLGLGDIEGFEMIN